VTLGAPVAGRELLVDGAAVPEPLEQIRREILDGGRGRGDDPRVGPGEVLAGRACRGQEGRRDQRLEEEPSSAWHARQDRKGSARIGPGRKPP
jgi:hypothetical protein